MKLPNGLYSKKTGSRNQSAKKQSNKSMLRQKGQFRARMILLNSAVALIVIMIVLVCKVISLNNQDTGKSLHASKSDIKQEKEQDKKEDIKKKENGGSKQTPKPTNTPVAPAQAQPQTNGSSRWLRKDLDKNKPMVALTFDDGPYTPVTKRILAALKKNDAKATFFCVGSRVGQYPEAVKAEYEQGCQVASHTYGHVILTKLKTKKIREQIDKANEAFQKVIGCSSTVLRPPGGLVNKKVRSTVKVPMICWTVDSEDWKSRNKKKVLKECKNIKDGDIVLMHDLYPSTAAAAEKLIPSLKKKGFQMVTVDELFYYKGIQLENGKVYFSAR